MRLPKSKKAGNTRTKASIAFFIIAQLILAIFASSTAIAASIKYDDSYTYDGGSSSDGIAWGDSSLDTKLSGYPSGTQVVCFDWCSGDSKFDHCYGKSGDIDTCRKGSKTLDDVCKAGNCVSLGWFGSVGDWHPIDTGNAGERWTCAISARYYYACKSSGSYSYGDSGYTDYYITYPRRYDCDGDKTKTYDDKAYYGSSADKQIRSDISCSGSRLCDEDKDDSSADYGLYGTSKPNEPCSVPDEKEDCNSDSDCFSGSKCDCDDWWDCTWDVGSDEKDYCCPSGQKWDGSKCATPCTDNDGDGHKDSSCGGDDCNDADSGVWKKNTCGACAKEPSGIGDSCAVGVGACQKTGKYKCDTAGTGIECDVSPGSPSTETCNSVDDDCDGETDEGVKNACGSCGSVPSETCGDGKDNDCDGSIDEGCCTNPEKPYYCAKTSSCWTSKAQCDQAITCDNVWTACKKPEGNAIKCVRNVPGCCNTGVPYFCPENGYCFSSDTYCDGRKVENCNGKYQICNKKTDEGKCFGDTLRCCPSGETWWESDKQCHKSTEPQKCAVPDGSSANCDCDSDSECAKADPSKPYCEENYPSPISDGHDACIASPPEYCGNGNCNAGSGEDYKNCASDCGQNAPKGTITAEVVYYGGSQKDKPIQGAYVYLDGVSKGNTNKDGKLSFQASYGSRTVKVECADSTFCDSITISLAASSEYKRVRCTCNPPGDFDGDGYGDEEEKLLGTDPFDPAENTAAMMGSYKYQKGCLDTASSATLQASHTAVVQAFNTTQVLSQSFDEKPELLVQTLADAGLLESLTDNSTTLKEAMQTSESITILTTKSEILLIATDEDTGVTSIIKLSPSCAGTLAGIGVGVVQSTGAVLIGFADLADLIGKGVIFLLSLPFRAIAAGIPSAADFEKIAGKVGEFAVTIPDKAMRAPGAVKGTIEALKYQAWMDALRKGSESNPYGNDKKAYIEYQLGFFNSYVGTYALIQVLSVAIPVEGAIAWFAKGSAIAKGAGIARATAMASRISKIKGYNEAAVIISKLKIAEKVADWTVEKQDAFAALIKLAKEKKVKDFEKWLDDAGEAGAGHATDAISTLKKTGKFSDDQIAELMNSKLGRQTLTAVDSTDVLILKQSKLVQKWGVKKADEVVSKAFGIGEAGRINDLNKVLKAMPEGIADDLSPEKAVKFLGERGFADAAQKVSATFDIKTLNEATTTLDDYENLVTGANKALKEFNSLDDFSISLKICHSPCVLPTKEELAKNLASQGKAIAKKIPFVKLKELPKEAQDTIELIEKGGPFPFPTKDGIIHRNDELRLPSEVPDYYQEFTVPTPLVPDRGLQRIVTGKNGEIYYSPDHYKTFKWVIKK